MADISAMRDFCWRIGEKDANSRPI